MPIKSRKIGPGTLKLNVPRTVASVSTTTGNATITAAAPRFISGDVGAPITGAGIPAGATITAVASPTQATLSATATATGTITATITPAAVTDPSCQFREALVEPTENVDNTDPVPHLCGEDLTTEDTVTITWRLKGKLTADLEPAGFTDFTWANQGKVVWAEYIPNSALGRKVIGPVRVVPLAIGGAAKNTAEHDLDWAMPVVPPTFV